MKGQQKHRRAEQYTLQLFAIRQADQYTLQLFAMRLAEHYTLHQFAIRLAEHYTLQLFAIRLAVLLKVLSKYSWNLSSSSSLKENLKKWIS